MLKLTNCAMRQHYNSVVKSKYHDNYELERWHSTPSARSDFYMTSRAISHHLHPISFSNCLEIGPGAGTWTKLLYRHNPTAQFDLVDISAEMHRQFTLEMRPQPNAAYHTIDFMQFAPSKLYDFVFSARTLEYFENQSAAMQKIYESLIKGGTGIIISGNPELFFKGRDKRVQHSGQYSAKQLATMLKNSGFSNIQTYPAIVRIHLRTFLYDFRSPALSEAFHHKWINKPLPPTSLRWCESYLTTFMK